MLNAAIDSFYRKARGSCGNCLLSCGLFWRLCEEAQSGHTQLGLSDFGRSHRRMNGRLGDGE